MNKNVNQLLAVVGAVCSTGANALAACPPQGWTMTWADEFNGSALDTTKWTSLNIAWPYNDERQYYTPSAVTVANGKLTITSRRQNMGGRQYTSGRLETGGKFSQAFGRFEVRAKLPKTQGIWPAHWLLPASNAWPPEIDIMEFLGHDVDTVYFTNHWGTAASPQHQTSQFNGPDFSAGFHNYAVEWFPDRMDFFVDGVKHATHTSNVPQSPFFIILNTAVGGFWPGYPDATTVFPQLHEVEWVRVHRRLINESFELAPPAFATAHGWTRFGNAFVEPVQARTGSRSGKLFGQFTGSENFSGFHQDLPAAPGEVWKSDSWWVNWSSDQMQGSNEALANIEFRDSAGQLINFVSAPALSAGTPTNSYRKVEVSGVAPAGTATVRLALLFRQIGNAGGAAFFDDVSLYRTSGTCCPADLDNGSNSGTPDGGIDINDLLYFLASFESGSAAADLDNGEGLGVLDGGIDINDLLFFLSHFEEGC